MVQISVCAPRFKVDSAGQVIPIAAAPDVLLRLNIVAFGPTAPYGMRCAFLSLLILLVSASLALEVRTEALMPPPVGS